MADYNFRRKLEESLSHLPRVKEVLRRRLGAIDVEVGSEEEDRQGIDYWASLTSSERVSIDLKVREDEYADLLIEVVSNTATMHVGWTLDPTKRTDFVLYLWPQTEQLISYPMLRAAATENLTRWTTMYRGGVSSTNEGSWRTRWIAVPDSAVFEAMHYRSPGLYVIETPGGPHCPKCGGAPAESQGALDPAYTRHRCGRCRAWWVAA